jgi:hypothetical protein
MTVAPAFLDNDNGDNVGGSMDIISFALPYGFVRFNPDHIDLMFYHHHHPPSVPMMDIS